MHQLPGGMRVGPGGVIETADKLRASRGSSGVAVGEIQGLLNFFGASPPLALDDNFGPLTEAAVRAFQAANGLTVDGVVGPETSNALQNSDSRSIGSSAITKKVNGMGTGTKVVLGAAALAAGAYGVKKLQEHRKKKRAA